MDNGKSVLLPGQSTQSPTNAPALDHEPVLAVAGPSTLQPENHKAVQSAAAPSTLLPEFHEAVPSAAQPSTLLQEEDSSEPIDINWDNDDTDSSSDESMPREELQMEEKIQRRLAFYQEMFDKSSEQHVVERAEDTRKRKAENLTRGKSLKMELEHHHDYIKKCFKKGMEEANMQGYVYGIVLHDNKVLSGSSESLRQWCDQTIVF